MSLFWNPKWKEYEEELKEAYQMGFADGRLCPQGRHCEVDGMPAIFHRWVEEDKALLQIRAFVPYEETKRIVQRFKEEGIVSNTSDLEIVRQTFALVEYDDGTVCKVEPEKVKFTDRRAE